MAHLFFENWETYRNTGGLINGTDVLRRWDNMTGNGGFLDETTGRWGGRCLRSGTPGTLLKSFPICATGSGDALFVSFALVTTMPTGVGTQLFMRALSSGGANQTGFRVNTDGSISALRGTTVIATSDPGIIVGSTWYRWEWRYWAHDSTGRVTLRINEVEVLDFTGNTNNTGGDAAAVEITTNSGIGGTTTGIWRIQDLWIWNAAGDAPNDWQGDFLTTAFYPVADGSHLGGSTVGSVDPWEAVAQERNAPDAGAVHRVVPEGEHDLFQIAGVPDYADVLGLHVSMLGRAQYGVGEVPGRLLLRRDTDLHRSSVFTLPSQAAFLGRSAMWGADPETSLPWDPNELSDLEIGVEAPGDY